jgi:serine/threonine protein kinase
MFMLKKGHVLETAASSYSTQDVLGEGGSGRVYGATDEGGKPYAIKVLDPSKATKERRQRFKNELLFGVRNRHPRIITVVDHGVARIDDGVAPFYVMPRYEGSLRSLMEGRVPPAQVLPCLAQILDGVEAAHKLNVTHRDLKPENILYSTVNGQVSLVVSDFGIAHFEQEDLYTLVETRPNSRLANFQYAAPEQRMHGRLVDLRADIYALGLILNEMFTGEILQGTGYSTIESAASEYAYLDAMVERMVRQVPAERFSSIDELKLELIARGNEFVNRQRISKLRNTVIPASEIDDPIVADPIRLVGIDCERDGVLVLKLSRTPTPGWVGTFGRIGNYGALQGREPSVFSFRGDSAEIPVDDEHEAQVIVNHLKNYLVTANDDYKRALIQERRTTEEAARRRVQHELQAEERRKKILDTVKI